MFRFASEMSMKTPCLSRSREWVTGVCKNGALMVATRQHKVHVTIDCMQLARREQGSRDGRSRAAGCWLNPQMHPKCVQFSSTEHAERSKTVQSNKLPDIQVPMRVLPARETEQVDRGEG